MPYSAERPMTPPSRDELRSKVPGWGVDLDPENRPAFPKLQYDPASTGAHWEVPEQQPGAAGRERSIEHGRITPAFGTSAPLHGVSGALRRLSYARFSEARAAHWLILLGADRVDAVGSHLRSMLTLRPDNPITQTGIRSELTHHGWSSRVGRNRADVKHQWLDPILVAGPWLVAGTLAAKALRRRPRD
jgi:hypothetical protein